MRTDFIVVAALAVASVVAAQNVVSPIDQARAIVNQRQFELNYQAGLTAFRAEDYETARNELKAAAALAPKRLAVWVALSETCRRLSDHAGALSAILTAITLKPEDPSLFRRLESIHSAMGEREKALKAQAKAIELMAAQSPETAADVQFNRGIS